MTAAAHRHGTVAGTPAVVLDGITAPTPLGVDLVAATFAISAPRRGRHSDGGEVFGRAISL